MFKQTIGGIFPKVFISSIPLYPKGGLVEIAGDTMDPYRYALFVSIGG